jgi:hypothetical protein
MFETATNLDTPILNAQHQKLYKSRRGLLATGQALPHQTVATPATPTTRPV